MSDIDRSAKVGVYVEPHLHRCENCKREWTCACQKQPDRYMLVCRDCETGTYNPAIHGGQGEKAEA